MALALGTGLGTQEMLADERLVLSILCVMPPSPVEQSRAPADPTAAPPDTPRIVARSREGRRSRTRDVVAPSLIVLLTVAVVLVGFWPGHMSADTLTQIEQARSGEITNHHAPVMIWLWSLIYGAGFGPGWALAFQVSTFVLGTFLVLRLVFRPLGAAIAAALVSIAPPVFGMLGYLSRDTLFASLLLLTFGLSAEAGRRPWRTGRWYAAGAVLAAWLTITTRQNAAAGVVVALVLLAGLAVVARNLWGTASPGRVLRRVLVSSAAGLLAAVAMMASIAGLVALIDADDVNPEQYLYVYDVAAMSLREGENLFPPTVMPERDVERVRAAWNIDSMLGYQFLEGAPIATRLDPGQVEDLADSWRDAVTGDPLDYLDERIDLFGRQIGLTRPAMWVYHPAIDQNALGLHVVFEDANEVARDYVELFVPDDTTLDGSIVHRPWPYLLIALAGAIAFLRPSRSWPLLVIGGLALASVTYQSGLFFGAMGTQYRFEFPSVAIGLIVLAVAARLAWLRLRAGSGNAPAH